MPLLSQLSHHLVSKLSITKLFNSLLGVTLLTSGLNQAAYAEPTGYNQLSFATSVQTKVENDEINASLYTKEQADDAKTLATKLNTKINTALQIAKRYPSVKVTTGAQNTYPKYDKNNKITGWTGQANIELTSTDITTTSQLIAALQQTLVMDNLNFTVSQDKRDAITKQLLIKASKAFQDEANSLTTAWNANGYRIISVNLNTGSNYYPSQPRMSMLESKVALAAAPMTPEFEAGDSTVTVTANGTIELVK